MKEKADIDVFLEHVPVLSVWYKALLTYLFQFIIFVCVMVFFWRVSSTFLLGALLGQLIIIFGGTFPYRYIAKNSDKIREKYRRKYGKLAFQYFWYHHISYAIPIIYTSLYSPLLLKTDYFLPAIVSLPSHFITNSLFPYYVALPLGTIIVVLGILIRRPSGGFGVNIDSYLYFMYPEKGRLMTGGIYRYIRNPRYLGRFIIAVGFGVLANNLLAVGVGFIHFLAFYALLKLEDDELARRFGDVFREYQRGVPVLFPRYGSWRKFVRFIFIGEKE